MLSLPENIRRANAAIVILVVLLFCFAADAEPLDDDGSDPILEIINDQLNPAAGSVDGKEATSENVFNTEVKPSAGGENASVNSVAQLDYLDAMKLALAQHPTVEARMAAIAAAEAELDAAEWKWFPTPAITVGHSMSGTPPGKSATLTQPLWTAGRITSEIDGRRAQKNSSQYALIESEQELIQKVAQAYSDAIRFAQRGQVADQNVREHERLRGIIERRVSKEVGAAVDLELADSRLQQARLELMQANSQRATMISVLSQLIGSRPGKLTTPDVPSLRWNDGQQLIAAALEFSPTLKKLKEEKALSESQVRTAESALWPQLSLRLQRQFESPYPVSPDLSAQFILEYQPGAGLSASAMKQAAIKRMGAADATVRAASLDLRDQCEARFNEAQVALQSLPSNRASATANGNVMQSYLRQFAAGRKTWLEVMNAQRELSQAQMAVADMEAMIRLNLLRVDALSGDLSRASIENRDYVRRIR